MGAERSQRRGQVGQPGGERLTRIRTLAALSLAASLAGGCSSSAHRPAGGFPTTAVGPLVAPKTTPIQDALYFQDLAKADPSLASYVNTDQGVALKALITDGSAFCAFLRRGGGIDDAMASVVTGANSVESQTHLPASVATYNAIDASALITLCPDEQNLIPSPDQAHIRQLEQALGTGTPVP